MAEHEVWGFKIGKSASGKNIWPNEVKWEATRRIREEGQSAGDVAAESDQQLSRALDRYLATITNDEFMSFQRILFPEYIRDIDLAMRVLPRMEGQIQQITELVQQAIDHGVLVAKDTTKATYQLLALIQGTQFWPTLVMGQPDARYATRQEAIDEAVLTFLARYKA